MDASDIHLRPLIFTGHSLLCTVITVTGACTIDSISSIGSPEFATADNLRPVNTVSSRTHRVIKVDTDTVCNSWIIADEKGSKIRRDQLWTNFHIPSSGNFSAGRSHGAVNRSLNCTGRPSCPSCHSRLWFMQRILRPLLIIQSHCWRRQALGYSLYQDLWPRTVNESWTFIDLILLSQLQLLFYLNRIIWSSARATNQLFVSVDKSDSSASWIFSSKAGRGEPSNKHLISH